MRPSVGRIVHYVSRGSADGRFPPEHRAAVVTEVDPHNDNVVGLCVLNPAGLFFQDGCIQDGRDDPVPGSWHWPERVE